MHRKHQCIRVVRFSVWVFIHGEKIRIIFVSNESNIYVPVQRECYVHWRDSKSSPFEGVSNPPTKVAVDPSPGRGDDAFTCDIKENPFIHHHQQLTVGTLQSNEQWGPTAYICRTSDQVRFYVYHRNLLSNNSLFFML